jgi:hypothetical protein
LKKQLITALTLACICLPSAFAEDGPEQGSLPRVLIIGDSISLGYTPHVTQLLKNKAIVKHHKGNAGHTGMGLKNLEKWLGPTKWDLIHFNWGLWDLCYRHPESRVQGHRDKVNGTISTPLEQYEKNLDQLTTRLKKTGAKLIWAHTTLVPEKETGRFVGDDKKYNDVAAKIMKRHAVTINDLHSLTKAFPPALFTKPGDVHYTKDGYQKIAKQVADAVLATLGGEDSQPVLAATVRRIDWSRFSGKITPRSASKLSLQILANSTRWGYNWLSNTYKDSPTGDRFLIPNQNQEHTIRPATSVAVGLAVAIRTGVLDEADITVSRDDLIKRTAKLIKGVADIHKANGGKWGDHWQSSVWAAQLCRAGWMLWEDLDDETKEMLCRVVVHEANRHIREGYSVPYWNGKGGDSKAEENSWEAMVLQQAIAMLPQHPKVTRWKQVCSELQISAFARKSDMNRNRPILDGKSPKQWLRGYNLREDGLVINHGLIHNDYMSSIAHLQMQGFLVCSLADIPVPQTIDFNFDVIYRALVTKRFASPPYEAPGGTMFIPGKAEQYYPQGTDWSRLRFACFLGLDTCADILGYGRGLPHKAAHWRELRAKKILQMQARHADGRMYAHGEFSRYPGREQMVLWMLSDVYLLQWLGDHNALAKKANWLQSSLHNDGMHRP